MGEFGGKRVAHAPPTRRRVRDNCRRKTRVGAWLTEFLPPMDRSVVNEPTGGDISLARVVARKVRRR